MLSVRARLRQSQCCDNSVMTLAILFSLKSMETLENGLQPHSGASLQSHRVVVVLTLTLGVNGPLNDVASLVHGLASN